MQTKDTARATPTKHQQCHRGFEPSGEALASIKQNRWLVQVIRQTQSAIPKLEVGPRHSLSCTLRMQEKNRVVCGLSKIKLIITKMHNLNNHATSKSSINAHWIRF
jgi:hypothetical protein